MNRFAYQIYEMAQLAMAPARAFSDLTCLMFKNPADLDLHADGPQHRGLRGIVRAGHAALRQAAFGIDKASVNGAEVEVSEEIVLVKPFCGLPHFVRPARQLRPAAAPARSSRRCRAITRRCCGDGGNISANRRCLHQRLDGRAGVPMSLGKFDLDDYIDYVVDMCEFLSLEAETPLPFSRCASLPFRAGGDGADGGAGEPLCFCLR